jgi:Dyp-type peroxidase family
MSIEEPILEAEDIQGHILRGFDTQRLLLIGLKFDAASAALRTWIRALSLRVDSLAAVHRGRQFRTLRRRLLAGRGGQGATDAYLNLALSFDALRRLGLPLQGLMDQSFRHPMGGLAAALGDPLDASGRPRYSLGADWDRTPDILLVLGSDSEERLRLAEGELVAEADAAGCRTMYREMGAMLPNETEHFGFRDGISQVGARGRLTAGSSDYLTLRQIDPADPRSRRFGRPGQPLVWPGQFVFGYPAQRENPEIAGPASHGGEGWMKNGSFLVFRRLRQDVSAFRAFVASAAPEISAAFGRPVGPELAGALLVGRWKDGTPLARHPERPDPAVAADSHAVNHFQFANPTTDVTLLDGRTVTGAPADPFGRRCPLAAHIRKVNPRDRTTNRGSSGRTLQFQMLRRGIPYGPAFAPETSELDRGLLFLAFMTSIDEQFMVLNSDWMNNDAAPEALAGHDMIVGQSHGASGRNAEIPGPHGNARLRSLAQWVIPTGGAFLFAPGVSLLRAL